MFCTNLPLKILFGSFVVSETLNTGVFIKLVFDAAIVLFLDLKNVSALSFARARSSFVNLTLETKLLLVRIGDFLGPFISLKTVERILVSKFKFLKNSGFTKLPCIFDTNSLVNTGLFS